MVPGDRMLLEAVEELHRVVGTAPFFVDVFKLVALHLELLVKCLLPENQVFSKHFKRTDGGWAEVGAENVIPNLVARQKLAQDWLVVQVWGFFSFLD